MLNTKVSSMYECHCRAVTSGGQRMFDVRKVLLCVSIYELIPYGQTRNSNMYCQQLDRLKEAFAQKEVASFGQ